MNSSWCDLCVERWLREDDEIDQVHAEIDIELQYEEDLIFLYGGED